MWAGLISFQGSKPDQNNLSPWKCLFLFTLTTSLTLGEIKPTQSNKVPKPGYIGGGGKANVIITCISQGISYRER